MKNKVSIVVLGIALSIFPVRATCQITSLHQNSGLNVDILASSNPKEILAKDVELKLEKLKEEIGNLPESIRDKYASLLDDTINFAEQSYAIVTKLEPAREEVERSLARLKTQEEIAEKEEAAIKEYISSLKQITFRTRVTQYLYYSLPFLIFAYLAFPILRNRIRVYKFSKWLQSLTLYRMGKKAPFKNKAYQHARLIAWHLRSLSNHLSKLGVESDIGSQLKPQKQIRKTGLFELTAQAVSGLSKMWDSWGIEPLDPYRSEYTKIGIALNELKQDSASVTRELSAREKAIEIRYKEVVSEINGRAHERVKELLGKLDLENRESCRQLVETKEQAEQELKELKRLKEEQDETLKILNEKEAETKRMLEEAESKLALAQNTLFEDELLKEELEAKKASLQVTATWNDEAAARLKNAIELSGLKFAEVILEEPPHVVAAILEESLSKVTT